MPLPKCISVCQGVPKDLRDAVARLPWNGVASVAIRMRGPRPDLGAWRYYADPDVIFTRLIFMHAFDSSLAPPWGWPLLAEIPWRSEDWPPDKADLTARVLADARRVGAFAGGEPIGIDVWHAAPAYVRFEHGVAAVVAEALAHLRGRGVHPLGRYGRWEYSSMHHAIADGFALGKSLREQS